MYCREEEFEEAVDVVSEDGLENDDDDAAEDSDDERESKDSDDDEEDEEKGATTNEEEQEDLGKVIQYNIVKIVNIFRLNPD